MPPLPKSPKQLSLGFLEAEIMELIWQLGTATVKEILDRILADPDRELTYASVSTVLNRLAQKGWIVCNRRDRPYRWQPCLSRAEAKIVQAHHQLQQFLAVGTPDVVAAFADSLDRASLEQIEEIARKLREARQLREGS